MVLPVRAHPTEINQGPRSRIAKLHFLRVCCSIAAPYHLPLHLSHSDGLHIEAALASANTKLLHTAYRRCAMYRLLRGVSTKKNVRIVGTIATRGGRSVSTASAEKKLLGFRAGPISPHRGAVSTLYDQYTPSVVPPRGRDQIALRRIAAPPA
jgi:hypothetical protein